MVYGGYLNLKMMLVVAHPDDECFAFGGALALAADQGVETYVICLTDGQAATHRGDAASGVTHHELLDYHDAQLEFTNIAKTAGRLVKRMRRFQPDVVLTFGSDGALNAHPDHMVVSMVTTAAFHWSGRPNRYPDLGAPFQPSRLFTLSSNFVLPDRQAPFLSPWTVVLDIRSVRDRKTEAFRQHTSQAPLMERTRAIFDQYGAEEFYTLLAARTPQPAQMLTDLFADL
jgi:LmbE family N-acetylglucosaminyl deacetylase